MFNRPAQALEAVKAIQAELQSLGNVPAEGLEPRTQQVLPFSIVRATRGYIEKVVNQINGCYENGWFDACAVMMRRLLETLIIEVFEKQGLAQKILNSKGDFVPLGDMISVLRSEPRWNLSRNTKSALSKLKGIGDKSAHSRRFNAHKGDVDRLLDDYRVTVQELIYLARLK